MADARDDAERLPDICECPKCGRQHRNLGFGKPPPAISEAELELRQRELRNALSEKKEIDVRDATIRAQADEIAALNEQLVAAECVLEDEEAGALDSVELIQRQRKEIAALKAENERLRTIASRAQLLHRAWQTRKDGYTSNAVFHAEVLLGEAIASYETALASPQPDAGTQEIERLVVELEEFDRIVEVLNEPRGPSEGALAGAEILRGLSAPSRPAGRDDAIPGELIEKANDIWYQARSSATPITVIASHLQSAKRAALEEAAQYLEKIAAEPDGEFDAVTIYHLAEDVRALLPTPAPEVK